MVAPKPPPTLPAALVIMVLVLVLVVVVCVASLAAAAKVEAAASSSGGELMLLQFGDTKFNFELKVKQQARPSQQNQLEFLSRLSCKVVFVGCGHLLVSGRLCDSWRLASGHLLVLAFSLTCTKPKEPYRRTAEHRPFWLISHLAIRGFTLELYRRSFFRKRLRLTAY